jgi:hypothetical protein
MWFIHHHLSLIIIIIIIILYLLRHLNMSQATGKQLGNGSQEPGKEFGFLAIMIDGGIGSQAIMRIAKPPDIMLREGFGSRGVVRVTKDSLIKGRKL